jgi:hypothetical protein
VRSVSGRRRVALPPASSSARIRRASGAVGAATSES